MFSRGDYLLEEKNGAVIQKGESSEKTALQQPVKLQPSWEEANLPEEELNFQKMSMDEASLQLNAPKDRYHIVYWIFLIHGIGVLIPWNMLITANDYFTKYKLSYEYTGQNLTYGDTFLPNLGFASQVPNVIFNWVNIFVVLGGNLTTRIVWSIWMEVVIFLFTIVLAMTDTSGWPGVFFWLTMASASLLHMMNGVYQNTIFGMAAKLPPKYTGAVILGSNICGTFTAVISVISKLVLSNRRMAAIYYFITALLVLLICFDTYFALPLNRFYRHHELKEKRDAELRKGKGTTERTPYWLVFQQAYPQLLNIFLVFFVTLSLFPAVQADILPNDPDFFVGKNIYSDVTCFLTFNICAMLGSFFTKYITWPKPKYLWIPVVLRFLYIPFYLLCNYQLKQARRTLPVYVTNDWLYWCVAVTMGLSSGYLSSLGMMYAPGTVEPRYASTAGMFGGAALITGIFCGVCSAYLWPLVITHIGV